MKTLVCRNRYVNAPDDYLFEGGANKICGGYTMFSSTRSHWEMLQIQRIQTYDQLYTETPSMEWMLAPLDPYGGGPTNGTPRSGFKNSLNPQTTDKLARCDRA